MPTKYLPIRRHDKISVKRELKEREQGSERDNFAGVVNFEDGVLELTELDTETRIIYNENLADDGKDVEVSCKKEKNSQVQTIISMKRAQLITYTYLSDDQLKHFTGFSRNLFTFFCDQFGRSYQRTHHYGLCLQDELLVMLMKYRLNLYYLTLASLFDVDRRLINKIVISWSKHMYKCFRQMDFWNLITATDEKYKIVLDCTEFRIERSSDPIIQQTTYSTYYSTNTFKVLIGGTENGGVGFVSDVYGGSISDRQITKECGLLNLLQEGDFVLADRGFDISDLLEERGVVINIPPFKRSSQLSEEDVAITRIIANRRIIIENLIGLAKKNKVLSDRIPVNLWPIVNEITYNCFMIINFKTSIVN